MNASPLQAENSEPPGRGPMPAVLSTALSLALGLGVLAGYLLGRHAAPSPAPARQELVNSIGAMQTAVPSSPSAGLTVYLTDGPDHGAQGTAIFTEGTGGHGPVIATFPLDAATLDALRADAQLALVNGAPALVIVDLRTH